RPPRRCADHGGHRVFGAGRRRAHPRRGGASVRVEADLGDALRRDGRAIARECQERGSSGPRIRSRVIRSERSAPEPYLIFASLNSTCLRTFGSYFLKLSFSVCVRGFFLVT